MIVLSKMLDSAHTAVRGVVRLQLRNVDILPLLCRSELLNEFMDSAKASNSPAQAIEIVQLASAFSLPVCEGLTQRVMADFALSQEQK